MCASRLPSWSKKSGWPESSDDLPVTSRGVIVWLPYPCLWELPWLQRLIISSRPIDRTTEGWDFAQFWDFFFLQNSRIPINQPRISIPVTIQGVYLCSLFCRDKAVCDTLGLQNDQLKICLVYILGSTGFLQNDLVFLQGQHEQKRPNTTSYVNPRMHFVGFSNSRQTWGII